VRRCEEPQAQAPDPEAAAVAERPRPTELGPWDLWPWCLIDLVPEAAEAASVGTPVEIIWHFQLAAS